MSIRGEPLLLYVVGTAGAGKSKFTAAFDRWMTNAGFESITVNLDPGAETLPYVPDVDVREWIVLSEVMDRYGLGPNGAQVVASDLLALEAEKLKESIEECEADYILLDTPGQTELFVFRDSGRAIVDLLGHGRSALIFLLDPFLSRRPTSLVVQLLLAATTHFRFGVPMKHVLSKADLVLPEEVERILEWGRHLDSLYEALLGETDLLSQMNADVFKVLEGMGAHPDLSAASSETLEGMEDVYAFVQSAFEGGEDLEKR